LAKVVYFVIAVTDDDCIPLRTVVFTSKRKAKAFAQKARKPSDDIFDAEVHQVFVVKATDRNTVVY